MNCEVKSGMELSWELFIRVTQRDAAFKRQPVGWVRMPQDLHLEDGVVPLCEALGTVELLPAGWPALKRLSFGERMMVNAGVASMHLGAWVFCVQFYAVSHHLPSSWAVRLFTRSCFC